MPVYVLPNFYNYVFINSTKIFFSYSKHTWYTFLHTGEKLTDSMYTVVISRFLYNVYLYFMHQLSLHLRIGDFITVNKI